MRVGSALLISLVGAAVMALAPGQIAAQEGSQAEPQAASQPQQQLPPAIVRSVVVSGNQKIAASAILDAITRTEPGKKLSREDIQADQRSILALGYFQSVSVDVQSLSMQGSGQDEPAPVRVVFTVVENPVLERVTVELAPELAPLLERAGAEPADIGALMELPTGKVAHGPTITERLQDLPSSVWERYGILTSPGMVDLDEGGTLKIELVPIRVGRIDVTGNNKTRTYVITREITVKPGQILQLAELQRSVRRINMLGFFEEVNADLKGISGKPYDVAVEVSVKERRTGDIQMGVSWSPQGGGLQGLVDITEANFLGRAQQVGLTISIGADAQRYQVSFTEPYLNASGTSLGFKLGWEQSKDTDDLGAQYWDRRYGGDVTVGHPISEFTRAFLTFTNSRWEAPLVNGPGDSDDPKVMAGTLRSLRLSTVTDTSDNPFNPSMGQRLRLSGEFAGLGGDFDYQKYESSYSHYVPVRLGSLRHVLAARVSVGDMVGSKIPSQEYFRLGGADSLRGYIYSGDDDRELVGTRMAMVNAEYRFPIYQMLAGVVFVDAGEAWDEGQPVDLKQMKWDVGLGLRIDIGALGMIRLDYGMTREESGKFHFSIGQQF